MSKLPTENHGLFSVSLVEHAASIRSAQGYEDLLRQKYQRDIQLLTSQKNLGPVKAFASNGGLIKLRTSILRHLYQSSIMDEPGKPMFELF